MAIYLDHAASTPVRAEVTALMVQQLGEAGNPAAVHAFGQASKMRLEQARDDIAAALNCDRNEVIFTSGGTEANNLAVIGLFEARNQGALRPIVLTLGTEHHAVLEAVEALEKNRAAQVEIIPIDSAGYPDLEWFASYLAENADSVALATAIWANNETGTVVDIAALGALCKTHGVPMHTDAVAAVGHVAVDFASLGVSTLAYTGHKLGAPVGAGALLVARGAKVAARSFGGSQERGIRPGTQDSIGASALALATSLATAELESNRARWEKLRARLIEGVAVAVPEARLVGAELNSSMSSRLSNIINFIFPGCAGDSLLFLLDSAGVAISNGSACTAGVVGGSHVLLAMGYDSKTASSCVRVSFGHGSTESDIDGFLGALPAAYERAKKAGFTAR
jgi:cysteine desulfurase